MKCQGYLYTQVMSDTHYLFLELDLSCKLGFNVSSK